MISSENWLEVRACSLTGVKRWGIWQNKSKKIWWDGRDGVILYPLSARKLRENIERITIDKARSSTRVIT